MRRVLDTSGLSIDRNTYYNLVRDKLLKQSNDSFEGLIFALKEEGFRFNCLMADELAKDDSCKERVLKQVFFITNAQIAYSKRFIADQMLLINETFETNQLRLILLIVVGITSINKNFPAVYSFVKSETVISFNFLFNSFRHFVFGNDIAESRVVLAD
jgi:hypothetical protein